MFGFRNIMRALGSVTALAMLVVASTAQTVAPTQSSSVAPTADKAVASVNGETIMVSEVQSAINDGAPKDEAIKELVDEMLVRQFIRKSVAAPTATDLAAEREKLIKLGVKKEVLPADNVLAAKLQWTAYVKARITDDMCKKYYSDNKVYFDKVTVRASHILIKVKSDASQAEKQVAYNKAAAIRQQITGKEIEFADAAMKYSECPSKERGGDIGHFEYKFAMTEPFSRVAFGMQIGEVSTVVVTAAGYHIIKVTDRSKGEASEFAKCKEWVREAYSRDVDLYQAIVNHQRQTARIDILMK
ncbi:MAG: hypothetical protein FJ271_12875 [Planctomycetes bacterium]|nr:hypothetical protein [Planctomycetota bacterium]